MSKRRYHRRSKMKRRGVKNGSQHGSKMAPKWLPNGSQMAPKWLPGGLWAALGPDPAARRPEASRRGSGTARGVPKNSSWRPRNALGAKSGSILASWRVPGRVPEGVWQVIWGAFWRLGRRERKRSRQVTKNTFFLELFLHAFSYRSRVCSVRLGTRRRESTT